MLTKYPEIITSIALAVSEKLGRESTIRKVKNSNEYFILDLAFSYFQKADRNRRNDYRSGFLVCINNKGGVSLFFYVTHSPIMFSFLKENFQYEVFRKIIKQTSKFRREHSILFKKGNSVCSISKHSIHTFLKSIDDLEKDGFARILFSKSNSTGNGLGNIFSVCLSDDLNESNARRLISFAWPLFLWLYPSKPIFKRDASLNRNMKGIVRQCEIKAIKNLPISIVKKDCLGQIEAAHIKPHKDGGSDKMENGIWLCSIHHKMTEGKISGYRTSEKINVSYD